MGSKTIIFCLQVTGSLLGNQLKESDKGYMAKFSIPYKKIFILYQWGKIKFIYVHFDT